MAAGAARAGRNNGLAFWNARDAHIEKAADDDSKNKKEEEDHGLTVPQSTVGLKKPRVCGVGWLTGGQVNKAISDRAKSN